MRVLLVIGDLSIGGAEVVTKNLALALSRLGVIVEIACYYESRFLAYDLEANGIVIHSLNESKFGMMSTARKLRALALERDIDVLHAQSYSAVLRVALSKLFRNSRRAVITFHNMGYDSYPPTTPYRYFRRYLEGVITRVFFDRWLAVSSAAADSYKRHLCLSRVEVVPNGIDFRLIDEVCTVPVATLRDRFGVPRDARLIVVPGRLVWEKGHRFFLEAVPKIVAACPGVLAIIVGDGPLQDELENLAAQPEVSSHLKIIPGQSQYDLFALMRSADIVCMPSLVEGWGLLVAEAMGLGVPIVTSSIDAIREVLGDDGNAVVVPPGDAGLLASAITGLLGDENQRRALGQKGRERALSGLSIDIIARKHRDIYRQLQGPN